MNIVMVAGCNNNGQERAEKELLESSLLFNDQSKNFFIKKGGNLIPIGGSSKQNKLTAGRNIEIVGTEEEPIVRLLDDVIVKTLTIRPDETVPDWKGTYKIGELKNGNSVLLLTKESKVSDLDQSILGGSILVKMWADDEEPVFAEYAATITSTGSWSLWGGTNMGNNIRVCKAKYNNEWYYGLKVPDIVKTTTTRTLTNHNNVASQTLCIQIGTSDNNAWGSRKIFIGEPGQGRTSLLLSRNINVYNNSDYNSWYYRKFSDIIDNMHLDQYMEDGMLGDVQDWYRKGYYINFWIYTQRNSSNSNQVQLRIHDILITKLPISSRTIESDPDNIVYDFNVTGHRATYAGLDFYGRNGAVSNIGNLLNNTNTNLTVFNFGGQSQDGQSANNQNGSYADLATFTISYQQEEIHTSTETKAIDHAEFWFNGWRDLPASLVPPQPNTSELEFQVLARESQDEDSFAEIFITNSTTPIQTIANSMESKQELGEDAPPYKWIIGGRALTRNDLKILGNACKNPDRQIYLDLSQCWMVNGEGNLNDIIFEGCSSLRGLIMPQGITNISTGIFVWCTYLRELDLSPSSSTLRSIGCGMPGSDGWAQSIGTFTSTRIRNLIIPKSVTDLTHFLLYSSNIENFIFLHDGNSNWPTTYLRTFRGLPLGATDDVVDARAWPKNCLVFVEQDFYNKRPTGQWWWNNDSQQYTREFVNRLKVFDKDWSKEAWQTFNDTYHWGEELINKIRAQFGQTNYIEILGK